MSSIASNRPARRLAWQRPTYVNAPVADSTRLPRINRLRYYHPSRRDGLLRPTTIGIGLVGKRQRIIQWRSITKAPQR